MLTVRLIELGKANQMPRPYIESFDGRFCDVCLRVHCFLELSHAQAIIEVRQLAPVNSCGGPKGRNWLAQKCRKIHTRMQLCKASTSPSEILHTQSSEIYSASLRHHNCFMQWSLWLGQVRLWSTGTYLDNRVHNVLCRCRYISLRKREA